MNMASSAARRGTSGALCVWLVCTLLSPWAAREALGESVLPRNVDSNATSDRVSPNPAKSSDNLLQNAEAIIESLDFNEMLCSVASAGQKLKALPDDVAIRLLRLILERRADASPKAICLAIRFASLYDDAVLKALVVSAFTDKAASHSIMCACASTLGDYADARLLESIMPYYLSGVSPVFEDLFRTACHWSGTAGIPSLIVIAETTRSKFERVLALGSLVGLDNDWAVQELQKPEYLNEPQFRGSIRHAFYIRDLRRAKREKVHRGKAGKSSIPFDTQFPPASYRAPYER